MGEKFIQNIEHENPESLKEIYNLMTIKFPELNHSENIFIKFIIDVLNEDPIRTKWLKTKINEKQLEFELNPNFPLNDFFDAAYKYLKNIGATDDEVEIFKKINYIR